MKEQNNIEGTVDKTSLKCKGVLNFFFFFIFIFFLCYHCGTSAIKPPVTLHPWNLSFLSTKPHPSEPSTPSLSSRLPSPLGLRLHYSWILPHSLLPSIRQTHDTQNEKKIHWFWRFLSFSSNWDSRDSSSVQKLRTWPIIKHRLGGFSSPSANTFYR